MSGLTRAERHNRMMDKIFDRYHQMTADLVTYFVDVLGYSHEDVDHLSQRELAEMVTQEQWYEAHDYIKANPRANA